MKWKNNNDFTGSSKKSMTSEMCNRLKNLTIATAIIWINFGVILIGKKYDKWEKSRKIQIIFFCSFAKNGLGVTFLCILMIVLMTH